MGDTIRRRRAFGYGAITLCGPAFNPVRLTRRFITPAGPARTRTHAPSTPRAQRLAPVTRARFGLIRFRSPLLTEHPFLQVLRCFTSLRTPRANAVPAHDGRRVPPFGNPRIKALLAAPRGLSQPHTSFIGTVCQGIHHTPFTGNHTAARDKASKHRTTDLRTNDHKTIRTKNKTSTRRSSSEKTVNKKRKSFLLASTLQFSNHHHDRNPNPRTPPGGRTGPGMANRARPEGPVAVREPKSMPIPHESHRSLPHQQPHRRRTIRPGGDTGRKPRPESP